MNQPTDRPIYVVTFQARGSDPDQALRAVRATLKWAQRVWGLRCIAISADAASTGRVSAPGLADPCREARSGPARSDGASRAPESTSAKFEGRATANILAARVVKTAHMRHEDALASDTCRINGMPNPPFEASGAQSQRAAMTIPAPPLLQRSRTAAPAMGSARRQGRPDHNRLRGGDHGCDHPTTAEFARPPDSERSDGGSGAGCPRAAELPSANRWSRRFGPRGLARNRGRAEAVILLPSAPVGVQPKIC
jgi:hypothetical protein